MAFAPGERYNTFHGNEQDYDFLNQASAHMAFGEDSNFPPGFHPDVLPGPGMDRSYEIPDISNPNYGEALNANKGPKSQHMWILDGGATHHFTPIRACLFDYVKDTTPMYVKVANNKWATRAGVGSIRVQTMINGIPMRRVIRHVWHMPTFDNSLLSRNQLKLMGDWVISGRNGDMNEYVFDSHDRLWLTCRLEKGLNVPNWATEVNINEALGRTSEAPPKTYVSTTAFLNNNLNEFNGLRSNKDPNEIPTASFARPNTSIEKETAELWHQRLGHMNMQSLQYLVRNNAITGITIPPHQFAKNATHPCEVCSMAKHNRAPFAKEVAKPTEVLNTASTDIAGPYHVKTLNMCAYMITFADWFTQFVVVALLRKKSDAFKELKRIIIALEAITGKKLKNLFSDRGGEYINDEMKEWFAEKGIIHDYSVRYQPEQNGLAKRMDQSLDNMA